MEEFEVFSKFDHIVGVVGHGVNIGEDMVKVDGISTEQFEPLGLRKLWDRFVAVEER